MVLVPAFLMVSTIRFRSFKTFDLQSRRSYAVLILFAIALALLASQPEIVLLAVAYLYLLSGFIGLAWQRLQRRPAEPAAVAEPQPDPQAAPKDERPDVPQLSDLP
jgi:CDP-diacylglycerol--serine O-phosphatidyltransferase